MTADHLSHYFTQGEEDALNDLLSDLVWDDNRAAIIKRDAVYLIEKIRATKRKPGSLESFFQQYGLNTKEGLALMSLAEALLRIPDPKPASALIRDKVAGTNWLKNASSGDKDWMTRAAGIGLSLTEGTINSLFSKMGEPLIREAMMKAMVLLGKQFVVGETLTGSKKNADEWRSKGFRFSYDMLGEGARTSRDADHYFETYKGALNDIAQMDLSGVPKEKRPGLSVKLSALHPRYEYAQKDECIPELSEHLLQLCKIAARHKLTITVDAEETARLIPSLRIFENVLMQESLKKWEGFGLAVQAYQKSAPHVIDHVISLARTYDRKIQVRLVKGAYWDTEVKHAQVHGLKDYSVYTRKSNTDVSYLRCAQKLLNNRDVIYPMFGTHNAHTVSAVLEMAGNNQTGFEFQKLFGMGDALYNALIAERDAQVCVYAPVGPYQDLLPYLVRRMLENGANSSFVNQIYNPEYDPNVIASDPVRRARENEHKRHPNIPLPDDIFGDERKNSVGFDFDDPVQVEKLLKELEELKSKTYQASSIIGGKQNQGGISESIINPADSHDVLGEVYEAKPDDIERAFVEAHLGHKQWSSISESQRAQTLEKIADLYEENSAELISLCVREGGRTIKDAHDEVREAVDFCRYYAAMGRTVFDEDGLSLPSPTGETNIYKRISKGVFVAISPWNFPLAIYTGQIVAALMVGNAVIAKPAEQTPLTGCFAVKLMHQAGVPSKALSFLPGDGRIGAMIVDHKDVAGVSFTGSTAAAQSINRSLAAKEGAIGKLIAETGGQNAMIVDSSALTEQVIDDVILSAFGSAGQRCSACRILYLQDDIADKTILMLQGAMAEMKVGDPSMISSDVGPLINEEAMLMAQKHKTKLSGLGRKIAQVPLNDDLKKRGHYFAPVAYEIDHLDMLDEEIFAPVLHVIRFKRDDIDQIVNDINDTGYGLTFGIHSRNQHFIEEICERVKAGNIYVNRGTIGAVVGVQPFGGLGLSGTGPKAGGPQYLCAFSDEKVISTDTTAAGGNASLVMMTE